MADDEKSLECLYPPGFYNRKCAEGHVTKGFMRCHRCINCDKLRNIQIRNELLRRITIYYSKKQHRRVSLWTLGTSSESFGLLRSHWAKFRNWLKRSGKRQIRCLYYVFEKGTLGGRAHIHILVDGFASHSTILRKWRSITREQSNVNYRIDRSSDFTKAVNYVTKYVTKSRGERRNYYYLSDLIKIRADIIPAHCGIKKLSGKKCDRYIVYYVIHNYSKHDAYKKSYDYYDGFCPNLCNINLPKSERLILGAVQTSLEPNLISN